MWRSDGDCGIVNYRQMNEDTFRSVAMSSSSPTPLNVTRARMRACSGKPTEANRWFPLHFIYFFLSFKHMQILCSHSQIPAPEWARTTTTCTDIRHTRSSNKQLNEQQRQKSKKKNINGISDDGERRRHSGEHLIKWKCGRWCDEQVENKISSAGIFSIAKERIGFNGKP